MTAAKRRLFTAACILVFAGGYAFADRQEVRGRTGLPTVKVGGEKVWMESAVVKLNVVGANLSTVQEFRLHYPGHKLEKNPQEITVAVREDYYRGIANGAPEVTEADAKGFTNFGVWVDGKRITTATDPWDVNKKKDTATRWRTWTMNFNPDQRHTLRIVSTAPLGWLEGKRSVQFMAKDLGHWRNPPDYLEIRLSTPGKTEARLAGLEPRPKNINPNAVQWVWRKASPNRDIYVLMPTGYAHRSSD